MQQGRPEAGLPDLTAEHAPPGMMWADTLNLRNVVQDWRRAQARASVDGTPLTLNGQVYARGIGTHAYSEMIIDLKGAARSFHAVVGVDAEAEDRGAVVFVVWVDGKEAARSRLLRGGEEPQPISVDLIGAQRMKLIVEEGDDSIDTDHADWGGALFVLEPGVTERPMSVPIPVEPPPDIAMGTAPEPAIHAPRITGGTPGRPFAFQVPATGAKPLRYSARDLPAGLQLDAVTGIISGALHGPGTTPVEVTVEGPAGVAKSTLTIVGGERALALTPPLGWNSWNVWGPSVDDAKVRAAADWMVKSGLAAHGYQYINIDDAWEAAERDEDGRIRGNEKFPDMKALADYVHSKGLKLGIYSSPGPKTCGGYLGSYEHERLDAKTYAEWGIDFLKYDWCSYDQVAPDHSLAELRKPYELMREALDDCGRDIVFSLCQYGWGNVSEWGADVGGNCWRTTGDIWDSWFSMSKIGFAQNGLEPYAGPGHWNDPDMLVVGKLGWGEDLHPSRLSPHEQITHITLWTLLASPLLIGCDLAQLDDFTLALLSNPDVLEVSQDPLGRQAARVAVVDKHEVWARPLADGSIAVGLFNRSRDRATITATWEVLGLDGPQNVRNLWKRQGEGSVEGAYSASVAGRSAVFVRISPVTNGGQ